MDLHPDFSPSLTGHRLLNMPRNNYVYAGSKHAVKVLTEGLRRELRDLGTHIRVTVSTDTQG